MCKISAGSTPGGASPLQTVRTRAPLSFPPKKSHIRAQQPLCHALTVSPSADDVESYLDVEVQLKRERRGSGHFVEWWVLRPKGAPAQEGNVLPMVIFNDKVSPPSLGFLAGYGYVEGARVGREDAEGVAAGLQGSGVCAQRELLVS